MRKPAVTLNIAQPWAAMPPRGAGRPCTVCQQVVSDYTQKTDAEILAVLAAAAAAGQICERFWASLGFPSRAGGLRLRLWGRRGRQALQRH